MLFCLALSFSCTKEPVISNVLNSHFKKYIYAYTNGTISARSEVRINFLNAVVGDQELQKEIKSIFDFSPSVKGSMYWESPQTLVFKPDEKFDSNTDYTASIDLKKVLPQIEGDSKFNFGFKTKALNYNYQFSGLNFSREDNAKMVQIKGLVKTSDYIKGEKLEDILSGDFSKEQISWIHNDAMTLHNFTISGFVQNDKDQNIALKFSPSKVGIDKEKGKYMVNIPPKGNFKLLNVIQQGGESQSIRLLFSDELDNKQNLSGLITISDSSIPIDFGIEGNTVIIYPQRALTKNTKLRLERGIRSAYEEKTLTAVDWDLVFKTPSPKLMLSGDGMIASDINQTLFPFKAINLDMVDVEIFQIYNNNLLQFLQTNNLNGGRELHRVGKVVLKDQVTLSQLDKNAKADEWNEYALDISKLIQQEPNAIYQVRIGFRPGYLSTGLPKDGGVEWNSYEKGETSERKDGKSIMNAYYGSRGYYNNYEWGRRDDLNYPEFYRSDRFIQKNIISSDVGIIAKRSNTNDYTFIVSNLNTAAPLQDKSVKIFDFQQQLLTEIRTDANGIAKVSGLEDAFVAIAESNDSKGFIKLTDNNALSLSSFDISGTTSTDGYKGMFYGERGVWRPGDSLFLNFILQDPDMKLPEDYPVSFKFYNPKGTLINTFTKSKNTAGIYPIHLRTASKDITGTYRIVAEVGNSNFTKYLKIETVKPNRFKIKYQLPEKLSLTAEPYNEPVQVNWLHGAPASNVKTRVEIQFRKAATKFKMFSDFTFSDVNRSVAGYTNILVDAPTDEKGELKINKKLWNRAEVPGMMEAKIKITAFEEGGGFSTSNIRRPYSPYASYVGIKLPTNKWGRKSLLIDKDAPVEVVSVDPDGKIQANKNLTYTLYRVNWSWWWDRNREATVNYINRSSTSQIESKSIQTNAKGLAEIKVKVNDWGRYMIRICNESGHCTSDFAYAGSPRYNELDGNQGLNMLSMQLDKGKYNPGDVLDLQLEGADDARFLISIEKGGQVLETYWQNATSGPNNINMKVKDSWAPNVYASVALIQANEVKTNDRPLRLYGTTAIMVEDPMTKLAPEVAMPDKLEPLQEFELEVSEESGKPMAYTIAIVDEGLLDLTNFKTPNPWNFFYQKEALNVKSFDLYDQVLGRFSGQLGSIVSVGGGMEDAAASSEKKEANRLDPVVLHAGPFYLKKGKSQKHSFTMPNYLGSVKAMVVAVDKHNYGAVDKTVKVNKPIMVLPTLPRVLGTTETLSMPVTVFNNTAKRASVEVSVNEKSGLVSFDNTKSNTVQIDANDSKVVYFPLSVGKASGVANFVVKAKAGKNTNEQTIELEVRNPNPIQKSSEFITLAPGDTHSFDYLASGSPGTNKVELDISAFPKLNFQSRLKYLIRYPYGCLEQTTSSIFPQLYLSNIMELDDSKRDQIDKNIQAGIKRLNKFITPNSGFSYWPGEYGYYNTWANTYAGHFLVEAKKKGYTVPDAMFNNWLRVMKNNVRNWSSTNEYSAYAQSYALYVLALAGEADLAAMNRIKESGLLKGDDLNLLAGAYYLAGQINVANNMLYDESWKQMSSDTRRYRYYGSVLRDKAIMLQMLNHIDIKGVSTANLAKHIAESLNERRYYNTQTLAMSLKALGDYIETNVTGVESIIKVSQNGKNEQVTKFEKVSTQMEMAAIDGQIKVINQGSNTLYINLNKEEQPLQANEEDIANNLSINVEYFDKEMTPINIEKLDIGTEFICKVTVSQKGIGGKYEDLAINQTFPAGWEIINDRMDNIGSQQRNSAYDFRDIRDDRVYTFFSLNSGQKKVFYTRVIASYQGDYYLPSTSCESMYRNDIFASKSGRWVQIINPINQ